MDSKSSDRQFLRDMHIKPEFCSFCERDREIIGRQRRRIEDAEAAMEEEHGRVKHYKQVAAGWMTLSCLLAAVILMFIAQAMGKLPPQ